MPPVKKSKHPLDSLIYRIQTHASRTPDLASLIFLEDGISQTDRITFGQLDQRIRAVALFLLNKKLSGKQVLLLFPAGIDFVAAFLGCLYAGATAVPVPCPDIDGFEKGAALVSAIAEDAQVSGILTQAHYLDAIETHCRAHLIRSSPWVSALSDIDTPRMDPPPALPTLTEDTIAYLQYTSGSTSAAKGVVITHGNLSHSLFYTGAVWHYTPASVTVTWAPHSHVYGLICGLLLPLYEGTPSVIIPTSEFVKNPMCWLKTIEQYKGTHSGCPNFGYDLCVQKISPEDCQSLKLETWKVAVNGGEPVRADTLDQFSHLCAPAGFKSEYFYPSYGMSEVTGLISTQPYQPHVLQASSSDEGPRKILNLGSPLPGLSAVVVDPETFLPVPEGHTGEVWLRGPSVALGYWQQHSLTQTTFNAGLSQQANGYLRTGDLGTLKNGELFLSGRLKELLIVYGKKYLPIDLESVCGEALGNQVAKNSTIVCSITSEDQEKVILIQEVLGTTKEADFPTLIKSIRGAISRYFQIDIFGVILVAEGWLPRTASGKLQRTIGRQKYLERKTPVLYAHLKEKSHVAPPPLAEEFSQVLRTQVSDVLRIPKNEIDFEAHISEYGFDSISITQLVNTLNRQYGFALSPAVMFEFRSLSSFCEHVISLYGDKVADSKPVSGDTAAQQTACETDIAIIGISGRFPGAPDVSSFWEIVSKGQDAITEVPADRWSWETFENTSRWGGFIQDVDKFDASFFNLSRHEAELMDPAQRLFLETVVNAIEDSGYAPSHFEGTKTGVYVGISVSDYAELMQAQHLSDAHSVTGSVYCMVANRVSYLLDLRGPSEAIDTACSSSLVAIHRAIQSIHQGECSVAIAGGVNLLLSPRLFQAFSRGHMLSPGGRCKTFDAAADGYVRGEGVGAVLLKPLSQALIDHDHIYGVIKGSATNHGGHVKSLTVPNPQAQAEVITMALQRANVAVETISYIETHGTGTAIGDPIEINGLKKAFAAVMKDPRIPHAYCGIGSVKTNIGHLEAAAGIAGVIKVLLALKHRMLPKSLHFNHLNPYIDLAESPFYIVDKLKSWNPLSATPYRAGVSSFGFGGVNAHLILEEAPAPIDLPPASSKPCYLIGISAKSTASLYQKLTQLHRWLSENTSTSIAQIAYGLNIGRDHFDFRIAVIAASTEDFSAQLKTLLERKHIDPPLSVGPQESVSELYRRIQSTHHAKASYEAILSDIRIAYLAGKKIDWTQLHLGERHPKLALPPYPFVGERYWIPENKLKQEKKDISAYDNGPDIVFSPDATSDNGALFRTSISNQNGFMRDHVFQKKGVLPGVFHIKAVQILAKMAAPDKVLTQIKKLYWLKPLIIEGTDHVTLWARLYRQNDLDRFELYSARHGSKTIHSVGQLVYSDPLVSPEPVSISGILSRLPNRMSHSDVYSHFDHQGGYSYGESFRSIHDIHHDARYCIARITQTDPLKTQRHDADLPLLDASIQANLALHLNIGPSHEERFLMPFGIEEISLYGALPSTVFSYNHFSETAHSSDPRSTFYDMSILDEEGYIKLTIKGLNMRHATNALKLFEPETRNTKEAPEQPAYFYGFDWQGSPITASDSEIDRLASQHKTVVLISDRHHDAIRTSEILAKFVTPVHVVLDQSYQVVQPGVAYTLQATEASSYETLVEALIARGLEVTLVVYLPPTPFSDRALAAQNLTHLSIQSVFFLTKALLKSKVKSVSFLYCYYADNTRPFHAMLSGFAKTLYQENYRFIFQLLELTDHYSSDHLSRIIRSEHAQLLIQKPSFLTRYQGDTRSVWTAKSLQRSPEMAARLFPNSVYLVTGGLGGIGKIVATFLATHYHATLILTGRSPLDEKKDAELQALKKLTPHFIYVQGDIAHRQDVIRILETAKTYGPLKGVFHCAGLTQDRFILQKEWEDVSQILAPKVTGTHLLDELTQDQNLDVFVLFASVAGVLGNVGQSDYATANAFLDHFADWRNQLAQKGQRQGHTVAIDWPVWQDGGIQVDTQTLNWMEKTKGVSPIQTETALDALTHILSGAHSQVVVATGDRSKIDALVLDGSGPPSETINPKAASIDSVSLQDILVYVKNLSVKVLKADPQKLDIDVNMENYGLESMLMLDMLEKIDKHYKIGLLPTVFSEYPTIRLLAQHIHNEVLSQPEQPNAQPTPSQEPLSQPRLEAFSAPSPNHRKIAVISVACRFPKSPTVEAYWQNLVDERYLVQTGIPPERWNHSKYYSADKTVSMKSYSKWGGFVDNVDLFDAKFFGIDDASAYGMDPQQRIMLELTQELFDRAGYSRDDISGQPISVILGGGESHYVKKFLSDMPYKAESRQIVNRIANMVASRISDFYNLTAYSHTLDAACSASLLAIHHACNSLLNGDAEMAIAGGSELSLDPLSFVGFSKAGALSDDGISYVFDERAKGFVMAEGFGLVLLKNYDAAIRDGDQILATLLATATNNDGRTVGLTTPSGKAQKQVIQTALTRSGISADTITYLEAHGTGTLLGDPIEVKAASEVYGSYTTAKNYCAIASVKSNIGHTLRSAGVASVIKVVLALQNQFIPATLNCDRPHPRFQFDKSPFYPNTKGKFWAPSRQHPRRAAVSTFAFGGTNVHAILEEHIPTSGTKVRNPLPPTPFDRRSYWLGNLLRDRKEILHLLANKKIESQVAAAMLQQTMSPQRRAH